MKEESFPWLVFIFLKIWFHSSWSLLIFFPSGNNLTKWMHETSLLNTFHLISVLWLICKLPYFSLNSPEKTTFFGLTPGKSGSYVNHSPSSLPSSFHLSFSLPGFPLLLLSYALHKHPERRGFQVFLGQDFPASFKRKTRKGHVVTLNFNQQILNWSFE